MTKRRGTAIGIGLIGVAVLVAASRPAFAAGWTAEALRLPDAVTALRQVEEAVHVRAGRWLRLTPCADAGICRQAARPPKLSRPRDGIPHGAIATGDDATIAAAWYTEPTGRYAHGVLGDRIEGGGLAVTDGDGRRHDLRLGGDAVFEDLTPRLADLDGDGDSEIVTIRSGLTSGAAIAVYELGPDGLRERAAIPPIGRANRWLNVAGIADFTGDGRPEIAIVKTPHIGGRLEVWSLRGDELVRLAAADGFSNHAIGATELGLSAVADADGDGVLDLALPNARRTSLRILSFDGGIRDIATVPLGGEAATAIGVLEFDGRPAFVVGLADGRLAMVREGTPRGG